MNAPSEDPAGAAMQHARRGHQPCERARTQRATMDTTWARNGNDTQNNTRTAFQTAFRDEDDLADTRATQQKKQTFFRVPKEVFQRD